MEEKILSIGKGKATIKIVIDNEKIKIFDLTEKVIDNKKFQLPSHFRFKLKCKECNGSMEEDGHKTMAVIDTYLAGHINEQHHRKFELEILP